MNRKILLIATLVVLTIISIGSISATEIDEEIISDNAGEIELDNSINDDVVGEGETPTININNEMTNDAKNAFYKANADYESEYCNH